MLLQFLAIERALRDFLLLVIKQVSLIDNVIVLTTTTVAVDDVIDIFVVTVVATYTK